MSKGTLSVEIKCANCGSSVFEFPDDLTDSTLIHCTDCGGNVGPYGSLKAHLRGEGHTVIGAHAETSVKPFKPVN